MIDQISVTKFMATNLITFTPNQDIRDAMKVILKNKISGAPVLNASGDLVGILSEQDCIRVIMDEHHHHIPGVKGTVEEFMSTSVTTIHADKTVLDAAHVFTSTHFRRLPVVKNGKLVGQISRRDILSAIVKMKPNITVVPDSWRGRQPVLNPSKRGRHTENA